MGGYQRYLGLATTGIRHQGHTAIALPTRSRSSNMFKLETRWNDDHVETRCEPRDASAI